MRCCLRLLDNTKAPHKAYKYSFIPDPRKLAPIESSHARELSPCFIRPPTKYVPDKDTFLEKCDTHLSLPTADFKSSFSDWNDLMTTTYKKLKVAGVPKNTAKAILRDVRRFQNGIPPERFDTKEEWQFWRQFKTGDHTYRRVPELPEKYRPHQMGQDSQPIPNYSKINEMPEWAAKEEERLKQLAARQ